VDEFQAMNCNTPLMPLSAQSNKWAQAAQAVYAKTRADETPKQPLALRYQLLARSANVNRTPGHQGTMTNLLTGLI
jgi:hypothetical protein